MMAYKAENRNLKALVYGRTLTAYQRKLAQKEFEAMEEYASQSKPLPSNEEMYFNMIEKGIEELRDEKYQQEKNGIAKALIITLNNLQDNYQPKIDSTKCRECGKPHFLKDNDAGGDKEILRLCSKCYDNYQLKQIDWDESLYKEFLRNNYNYGKLVSTSREIFNWFKQNLT